MIRTKETQLLMLPDEAEPKKPSHDKQYTVFFWLLFLLIFIVALTLAKWSVCCCNYRVLHSAAWSLPFHAEGKENCALPTNSEDYKYQKRELELCFTLQSR